MRGVEWTWIIAYGCIEWKYSIAWYVCVGVEWACSMCDMVHAVLHVHSTPLIFFFINTNMLLYGTCCTPCSLYTSFFFWLIQICYIVYASSTIQKIGVYSMFTLHLFLVLYFVFNIYSCIVLYFFFKNVCQGQWTQWWYIRWWSPPRGRSCFTSSWYCPFLFFLICKYSMMVSPQRTVMLYFVLVLTFLFFFLVLPVCFLQIYIYSMMV